MNARTTTTKQEAIELGLKRYFTGVPCQQGHYSERNASHACLECNRLATKRARRPEKVKAYDRARYLENKELLLQRARDWRLRNLEKDKARKSKWLADRPGLAALYARRRRSRKAASAESHTTDDIAEIAKAQKHRCAYCRTKLTKPQVDHIEPLARGGSNGRRNLQIVCRPCNSSKRAKDPIEFARSTGRLL
jgi:5-methylcytosine-specific restriction endonuclease McrA